MDIKKTHPAVLLILLIVSIVITAFHYTDNFIHYDRYPDPQWITPDSVYIAWIVLTLIGIAGYLLYVKRAFWIAYLCLSIYSLTGLGSPGHYFYRTTEVFSIEMHSFIWLDAIAGSFILGFVIWSGLLAKEWQPIGTERNPEGTAP